MKRNDQPSLFGGVDAYGQPLPAHQPHSPTSREAAESVTPHLNELQSRVLEALRYVGEAGLIDEEGIDVLAMSPSSYRPRRIELCDMGLVKDSGKTRLTRSGRRAVIWVLVTKGQS